MKTKQMILAAITITCVLFTGCGNSNADIISKNLNYVSSLNKHGFQTKVTVENEEFPVNIQMNGIGTEHGLYANIGITKDNQQKELTNLYFNRDGLSFETMDGEVVSFLSNLYKRDLYFPNKKTIALTPYNDYLDLQNINMNVLRKYINQGIIGEISKKDDEFIGKSKKIVGFSLTSDDLKSFLTNIVKHVSDNAENIFMDYYNVSSDEVKAVMNTSKESSINEIKNLLNKITRYIEKKDLTNIKFTYKNTMSGDIYKELIKFETTDGKILLNLENSIDKNASIEMKTPEETTDIASLDIFSDFSEEDEERNLAQLEDFYKSKYPESSRVKDVIKSYGYKNPVLSTSINNVSIYATRDSRSIDMEYGVSDEISVVLENDLISKLVLTNSFSLSDYELYGNKLILSTVDEISEILEAEFLLEQGEEFGTFEKVIDGWEFITEVVKVSIDDANGIVTAKLTAKQH